MGNFFLCRALVLLTENLYWAISILNDNFGTKCWKVVIFWRTHLSLFVTVGLPVSQVPASVPVEYDGRTYCVRVESRNCKRRYGVAKLSKLRYEYTEYSCIES